MEKGYISKYEGTEHRRDDIFDQFEWNVTYPADLFQVTIPSDYTRSESRHYLQIEEDHLIKGLRLYAVGNNGRFPPRLDKETVLDYVKTTDIAAIRQEAAIGHELSYYQEVDEKFILESICDAYRFYTQLIDQDKRVVYFGDQVAASYGMSRTHFATENETVLMYWKNSEEDYRVIRADLTPETLSADQLAQRLDELAQHLFEKRGVAGLSAVQHADAYLEELASSNRLPVTIRVLDESTGLRMSNINVIVETKASDPSTVEQGRTDRLGQCNIQLSWGDYTVKAEGWDNGRRREHRTTISVSRERKYLDVELAMPAFPQIKGRLVYDNGRPVRGGRVRIGNSRCTADKAGHFSMPVLYGAPQDYHFGYAGKGARARCIFFWRMADQEDDWVMRLEWPSTISGRIVNQKGIIPFHVRPVLYAHPEGVTKKMWQLSNRASIDAAGRFVFEDVPVGAPLELRVALPDSPENEIRVEIDELIPDQAYELDDIVLDQSIARD